MGHFISILFITLQCLCCISVKTINSRSAENGTYRICYGKYIGFALADISSLREQTYRLSRGLPFVLAYNEKGI